MVTGYKFAILKAQLKSEWGGDLKITTRHYFFEASELIEDMKILLEAEIKFWRQVEEKQKPDLVLPEI